NQTNADFGFGLWYQAEKFYVGLSIDHLQRSSLKFNSNGSNNNLTNHTYLMAGYNFRINESLNFRPSILVKTDLNTFSFEPTGIFEYSNYKVWGGVSYRSADAIIAMVGLSILKDNSLRIGYGFDFTVINQLAKAATSHEVMLSYILPPSGTLNKPVIKTPRFAF
ncbi:MAG: PorP/SprF family type IX secretion system membrane protein, partial [Cytophagales bacterium]|nr:PorP/SprF family type IX secretion system membrane protein [Cytophagales bacterium]